MKNIFAVLYSSKSCFTFAELISRRIQKTTTGTPIYETVDGLSAYEVFQNLPGH